MSIPARRVAVVTVATRNHFHLARCLFASIEQHLPHGTRFAVLVDRDDDLRLPRQPFEVIPLEALDIPHVAAFAARYGPAELSFATKPWALAEMFRRGFDDVLFLDADIVAYASLAPVLDMLDRAPILLTPHRLHPLPGALPQELAVLRAGAFNAGFIGLRRSASAERFVGWWQEKCIEHCVVDPALGLYGDQRWLDLVPGLFGHALAVRADGWNVGRWNLDERPVTLAAGEYRAGNDPLLFFHFSGLSHDRTSERSRTDESGQLLAPAVVALVADYHHRLDAFGRAYYEPIPYSRALPARVRRSPLMSAVQWLRRRMHRATTPELRQGVRGVLRMRRRPLLKKDTH